MIEVKKMQAGTTIKTINLGLGVSVEIKTPNSVTWAVCEDGVVVFEKSVVTGDNHPSLWPNKHSALMVAQHMNREVADGSRA